MEVERNTVRWGWDMPGSPFPLPDSAACAAACRDEPLCVSWAFTRANCVGKEPTRKRYSAGDGCRLKRSLVGAQAHNCSDSGWLKERMLPHCAADQFQPWTDSGHPLDDTPLPPPQSPFPPSPHILAFRLAPECSVRYTRSDTWYCSWAAGDSLRCLFEDGAVNGVAVNGHPTTEGAEATAGLVTVTGDDPFDLRLTDAASIGSLYSGYDGRFPSANVHRDGVHYVASALRADWNDHIADCGDHCVMGPLVSFKFSEDEGRTWTDPRHDVSAPTDNVFQQDSGHHLSLPVKFGEGHIVDLGPNGQWATDGFTYLISHGSTSLHSWELWNEADAVYLARVQLSPATVNDAREWQFWAGEERGWVQGTEKGVEAAQPLFSWPNHTGSVSMSYVPALRRYLIVFTAPHTSHKPLAGSDLVVLDSPNMTGPFSLVAQLPLFGPTAYFPTFPTKFISRSLEPYSSDDTAGMSHALHLWLSYSTLNGYNDSKPSNPPYSAYAWNLLSVQLLLSPSAYNGLHDPVTGPVAERSFWLTWLAVLFLASLLLRHSWRGLQWLTRQWKRRSSIADYHSVATNSPRPIP